MTVMMWL